jgi:hypothetical protein
MSRNFVYESFEDYVNYLLLIESEGDCPTCPKTAINEAEGGKPKKPWDFKFDSGKFKSSDVTEAQRKALENDFLTRVVPALDDPTYTGRKLKISLESASSKVPIDPNGSVAKALKSAGYTTDNKGLCNARAKTVTGLIGDIIFKKYAPKGMDKTKFLKSLDAKVEFAGVAKPDIGPDYVPGKDDPKDSKYKENQYISAMLEPIGGKTPGDLLISCNSKNSKRGGVADASNGFIGYDKTVFLSAKAGQKVKIKFDSFTIPDSIIFSYFGENKLVPFAGSIGRYLVAGLASETDSKQEPTEGSREAAALGAKPPKTEMKIGGKTYLVQDYKKYLNETVNKGGVLVKSIENKLKSLGLPPISQICPGFFDSEGKIEVYATISPDEAKVNSNSQLVRDTAEMIASGKLAKSPVLKDTQVSIEITKNITRDAVTLVAFSPVSGTSFAVVAECG